MKCVGLTLLLIVVAVGAQPAPAHGGTLSAAPPPAARRVLDIPPAPDAVPVYGLFETCFTLPVQYPNPFNESQILVRAAITPTGGDQILVDGFWFQNYTRALVNNVEVLTVVGTPQWCVRFSPRTTGVHTVVVTATDAHGTNHSKPQSFTATRADGSDGFVAVGPNKQHFATQQGQGNAFWPVGENVCWTNDTGTFAWDTYFQRMAASGATYARLWLTDSYLGDKLAIQTVSARTRTCGARVVCFSLTQCYGGSRSLGATTWRTRGGWTRCSGPPASTACACSCAPRASTCCASTRPSFACGTTVCSTSPTVATCTPRERS